MPSLSCSHDQLSGGRCQSSTADAPTRAQAPANLDCHSLGAQRPEGGGLVDEGAKRGASTSRQACGERLRRRLPHHPWGALATSRGS